MLVLGESYCCWDLQPVNFFKHVCWIVVEKQTNGLFARYLFGWRGENNAFSRIRRTEAQDINENRIDFSTYVRRYY
jgi:hypothetical protein